MNLKGGTILFTQPSIEDSSIRDLLIEILEHQDTKAKIISKQTHNMSVVIKVEFSGLHFSDHIEGYSKLTERYTIVDSFAIKHTGYTDKDLFRHEVNTHIELSSVSNLGNHTGLTPICPTYIYSEIFNLKSHTTKKPIYVALIELYSKSNILEEVNSTLRRSSDILPRSEDVIFMEMMEGLSLRDFAKKYPNSLHHRLYGDDILFSTIDDMQQFYVFLLSSIMAQYKYNHGDRTTNNIFLSFLQTETTGPVIVSPYLFDFGRSHEINRGFVQAIEYTEHIPAYLINPVNEEYRTILEKIYEEAKAIESSISEYIEEQLKEANCDYVYLMQLLSAYVIDDVDIGHKSPEPTYIHINSELFAFYHSMQGAETYSYLFDIDEHKKITLNKGIKNVYKQDMIKA